MRNSLPMEWVERIFMRLHGRFGNQFLDKWRIGQLDANGEDLGVLNAKQVWADGLAHLTPERIKKGLDTMYPHPPHMDEFVKACSPVPTMHLDHKALPKPAMDMAKIEANKKRMYELLNIKKVPN